MGDEAKDDENLKNLGGEMGYLYGRRPVCSSHVDCVQLNHTCVEGLHETWQNWCK